MTDTLQATETFELIELGEELHCESNHTDPGNQVCTHAVTHRIVPQCWEPSVLVCIAAARFKVGLIESHECSCSFCGRELSECWDVVPV